MGRVRAGTTIHRELDWYTVQDPAGISRKEKEALERMFVSGWRRRHGRSQDAIPERFRHQPEGFRQDYAHQIAMELMLVESYTEGFEAILQWCEVLYLEREEFPIHWTTAAGILDLLGYLMPNDEVQEDLEWFHGQIRRILPALDAIVRDPNHKRKSHVIRALKMIEIRARRADTEAVFAALVADESVAEEIRKKAKHVLAGGRVSDFEFGRVKLEDISL